MYVELGSKKKKPVSFRFGGISPVVLRELSGVYQPFVKAVKEIISNAYDADADTVNLKFYDDFNELSITDNGNGMNPIEFIRDYIRIGKSRNKNEFTAKKGRPRIGGKGIGFLAPARYCKMLEVKTKKNEISTEKITIRLQPNQMVDISSIIMQGYTDLNFLDYIKITKITDQHGENVKATINGFSIEILEEVNEINVYYEFDSRLIELTAMIDFNLLFELDSSKSLEEINNFCQILIKEVPEGKDDSYTEIKLKGISDFVKNELTSKGKKGAKNIESNSGLEKFLWSLSRIIPINANISSNFPVELKEFIQNEMDGKQKDYPIQVNVLVENEKIKPLERFIIHPNKRLDINEDADLIKIIELTDDNGKFNAKGFLIGQSSTIYPAECRGILVRVKGVAIGEPTYFGLDQVLTGSSKVALTQISGEINILSGIDAIHDINPGRDGFYKESKSFNLIKKALIGDNPEKISGDLKDIIDAIIIRSEINASLNNFLKRHEAQRKAILESSAAIAEMSVDNYEVIEQFLEPKLKYELQLSPAVKYKAEGKLASYTVKLMDSIEEPYKIDYVAKELILNSQADIWKKNINIAGLNYEIVLKHGKQKNIFCEVNPKTNTIYINWDHAMRSTMGDSGYIKHCLATVASALPQEQLNTYIKLITNKI